MKKVGVIITLLAALMVACGKVATESKVKAYVKEHYGEVEYLGYEKQEDQAMIYHFKDNTCGFKFYVMSYLDDFVMDGAALGKYETKKTDFYEQYKKWLEKEIASDLSKSMLQEKWVIDWEIYSDDGLSFIYSGDFELVKPDIEKAGGSIADHDIKHLFKAILVVDQEGKQNGQYDCQKRCYIPQEEVASAFYMERVREDYGIWPKFLYTEKKSVNEIEGLNRYEQVSFVSDEGPKTEAQVYYFEYKGETHFICDVCVYLDETYSSKYFYSDLFDLLLAS